MKQIKQFLDSQPMDEDVVVVKPVVQTWQSEDAHGEFISFHTITQFYRQTDRQTHTDRQAGRQAGRQTDRQTDRHTHTHTHTHTHKQS